MAKRKRKSNFKDTTQETVMSDFIQVDPAQIDIEDQIEEEVKPFTEEERVDVVEVADKEPRFKDPDFEVTLKGSVEKITNITLTEGVKQLLINNNICSESDFI